MAYEPKHRKTKDQAEKELQEKDEIRDEPMAAELDSPEVTQYKATDA